MIVNGKSLLIAAPIKDMERSKIKSHGVSFGLGEAGYDIRIAQHICFRPQDRVTEIMIKDEHDVEPGNFMLASAMERFQMPDNLVGIVHDKSTWARRGVSVFNTVIEPGWKGYLTLELVYHGGVELVIPAGSGIAQVVFHLTTDPAQYTGRYQNQPSNPVEAIEAF